MLHYFFSFTKKMLSAKALVLAVVLLSFPSFAEELSESFVPVHAMGMGGVSTATSDDENSMFTNPAGIARVRKARSRKNNNLTSFPNIAVGMNSEAKQFYDVLKKADDKNVGTILESSESLGDKPFWARASAYPVTMLELSNSTPTAFGLFANNTATFYISKDEPDVARARVISDIGAAIGMAFTNNTNRFNLGVSIRPTYRYAYEDKIPSNIMIDKNALTDRIKNGSNKSTGIGIDVGMMYTIADFWFPTVGIAALNLPTGCREAYLNPHSETRQNVCGTVFTGDLGNPEALSNVDPTDFRIGFSIMPRLTRKVALRLAFDVHHIYYAMGDYHLGLSDIEISRLIHGGAELVLGNPLDPASFRIRLGANQGFFTAGVSMTLGILALEFSSYGVDVSTDAKPLEDRRFLFGVTFQL